LSQTTLKNFILDENTPVNFNTFLTPEEAKALGWEK